MNEASFIKILLHISVDDHFLIISLTGIPFMPPPNLRETYKTKLMSSSVPPHYTTELPIHSPGFFFLIN